MIAGLCGFSGANYLCRVFKRETGLSPAAWRETAAHKAVVQKLPARKTRKSGEYSRTGGKRLLL